MPSRGRRQRRHFGREHINLVLCRGSCRQSERSSFELIPTTAGTVISRWRQQCEGIWICLQCPACAFLCRAFGRAVVQPLASCKCCCCPAGVISLAGFVGLEWAITCGGKPGKPGLGHAWLRCTTLTPQPHAVARGVAAICHQRCAVVFCERKHVRALRSTRR